MNERRLARLQEQIKARIAEILMRDMADPKLGLVTITRVELDAEFTTCKVFWSALGDEKARARTNGVLQRARGFVQREVGKDLHTRTVPRLEFIFDQRIEGAMRMQTLLDDVRREREEREKNAPPAVDGGAPGDGSAPDGSAPGGGAPGGGAADRDADAGDSPRPVT
jgi:ribosome-binding factor A